MNIAVVVKSNAKQDEVKYLGDVYYVRTKSPAKDGKANTSVVYLLSQYLGIPKSKIRIKLGFKSKKKVVEISE